VIVAAHQPNFLPWLGFFDKLARSDVLVLLDDVQFPRTGAGVWTNRVRLLVAGEPHWVTVPIVRSGKGVQRIDEVRIDDSGPWRRKLLRTIELNYAKAAGFEETFPFVRELVETESALLADFNARNLHRLAEQLGLGPETLVRSSTLATSRSGTELLVELTRSLGGTTYLSGDGAGGYQQQEPFAAAGIELRLQRFEHPVYPQLSAGHAPGLSIVDALLNCGFAGTRALLA
jgi:hypothetical protein